jgi:4-hydroxy-tetrahydrodipicolinate synthase
VGLKDATGDISRCCYMVKRRPQGFMLFTGDDATAMAFMLCGGDGVMSVVSNVIPKLFSELCKYALNGKNSDAIAVNNQVLELCDLMFIESNPIPIKWALFKQGIIRTSCLRLPLTTLRKEYQNKIKSSLDLIMREENNVN